MRGCLWSLSALMVLIFCLWMPVFQPLSASADDDMPDPDSFAFISNEFSSLQSLSLAANWNGVPLEASSTIPLGKPGTISWSYATGTLPPRHGVPTSFSDILSTAVLTLDLYKGTLGSSTLVFSKTIPSNTFNGTLPFTFDSSGQYLLAVSATYPSGTYPPQESPSDLCHYGDFCVMPYFLLDAFHQVATDGQELVEDGEIIGNYTPAAYGLLSFSVDDSPGPKDSNVLFLPGTLESRLYMKTAFGEHRLWEPSLDSDVAGLAMNPDGTSVNEVYTRDIMDYLYSDNAFVEGLVRNAAGKDSIMYGPFEDFMNGLVSDGTIKEWQAYPYDWRYDVSDIVQNGTLVATATSTPTRVYLQDVVQQLASSSPTGKVTVIAHSNGGLLAKALMVELQKENKLGLIDQLIMVGTPQLGTPLAIGTMLHGDDETKAAGLVMYSGTFRTTSLSTPGPYDLIPSRAYFSVATGSVVSFADDSPSKPYRDQYGASITSYSQLSDFLTNVGDTRSAPDAFDPYTPAIISSQYLEKADATHTAIDAWAPPANIPVTSMIGWNVPTVTRYSYGARPSGWGCDIIAMLHVPCNLQLEHTYVKDDAGDSTVLATSASALGRTLYLDAATFSKHGETVDHQSLLTSSTSQAQIKDLLNGTTAIEPYIDTNVPMTTTTPFMTVSVHSPMNILATDRHGNQTGIVSIPTFPDFSFIKEDIPGSAVDTVGEEKYLSLPEGQDYSFTFQGYDAGVTTIEVSTIDAQGETSTTDFANIPTTASTTGSFSITDDTPTTPVIQGDTATDTTSSTPANEAVSMENELPLVGGAESVIFSPRIGHGVSGQKRTLSSAKLRSILLQLLYELRASKTWANVLVALIHADQSLKNS